MTASFDSTAEFAKRLDVSERQVRRWIQRGMPAERPGRNYRIETDAAVDWVMFNARNVSRRLPLKLDHSISEYAAAFGISLKGDSGGLTSSVEDQISLLTVMMGAVIDTIERRGDLYGPWWDRYLAISRELERLKIEKRNIDKFHDTYMPRGECELIARTLYRVIRPIILASRKQILQSVVKCLDDHYLTYREQNSRRTCRRQAIAVIDAAITVEINELVQRLDEAINSRLENRAVDELSQ